MRRIFPLLLLICLLGGCAAQQAALPAADLTELLAAAVGRDLDIWAYDVETEDLARCAGFAEYTGVSTLSAPPENVTKYSRRYANGYCYESFHRAHGQETEDEPFDVVLITGAGDSFCQELSIPGNDGAAGSGEIAICDIDLDGHDDVEVFYHGAAHGVANYTAILWDAATERYRVEPSYQSISKPMIDKEHKIYWGGYSGAVYEGRSAFEYIDGAFVETHCLYIQMMTDGEGKKFSITESGANEEELNSVLYTAEDEELLPSMLERYAENDAVWPGWQWNDFWAHYQYG